MDIALRIRRVLFLSIVSSLAIDVTLFHERKSWIKDQGWKRAENSTHSVITPKTGIYTQESNGSKMLSPNLEMLLSDHEWERKPKDL